MKKTLMILTILIASSCASTSRMVKSSKTGGRVMILGSRGIRVEEGIADANNKMATKCPGGYEIIEEGWMTTSSILRHQASVEEKYFDFKCK